MDQQQRNHQPRTVSCLSLCSGRGGGLNVFYWYQILDQILVLDYVVVKAQRVFCSHGKMNCFCYKYPGSCLSEKKYQFTNATFAKYYIF